jgi:hypothetical protein
MKGVYMFTVRILWSDGFDPSVYEQLYIFDAATKNPQDAALRKARRTHKNFGMENFQLLVLAVCPDEAAWALMVEAAKGQYRKTCRMASSL